MKFLTMDEYEELISDMGEVVIRECPITAFSASNTFSQYKYVDEKGNVYEWVHKFTDGDFPNEHKRRVIITSPKGRVLLDKRDNKECEIRGDALDRYDRRQ